MQRHRYLQSREHLQCREYLQRREYLQCRKYLYRRNYLRHHKGRRQKLLSGKAMDPIYVYCYV